MNTQPPASSEDPGQAPLCGECEDERPPTVTITRSDLSEAAAFCLLCSAQVLSSLNRTEKTNMDLLTIEEVAELTRLPVATLRWYRAMGEGGPKSGKLGRRVVYRRADVEAWIAAAFDATGS